MRQFVIRCRQVGLVVLLAGSFNHCLAQEGAVASLRGPNGTSSTTPSVSESVAPGEQAAILERFVAAETKVREALNQHTFKRDVVLQTIGPDGEVTGEYVRNSQFIFDDRGRRIERVIFHPSSTIREMRITKEDIQDLKDGQLLGIDIVEATKYRLTYAGADLINNRQLFAVDVAPLTQPDPNHMKERYFVGRVWVDPLTFQIVMIKGIMEPQGRQRFPMFMTWREPVKDALAFPTRTEADDILHFKERDVHYRIRVRYYDYKEFGSRVSIKDLDEDDAQFDEASPNTKEDLNKKEPSSKSSQPPTQLSTSATKPLSNSEVCTTNRTSPPVGEYHWPVDTEVKVYFVRSMFNPAQTAVLLEAMKIWNMVGADNGSGVRFAYAGEADGRMSCRSCLTVTRREVFARDKGHYAFFHPMKQEEGRLLVSAWIDLDFGITDPTALQGFMAHEMGHGLGLWDCPSCKKHRSLMNSFPGINKNNGLVAPSSCDVATMRSVYQQERQIAAVMPRGDKPADMNSTAGVTAKPTAVLQRTSLFDFEGQRSLAGGAAAAGSRSDQRSKTAPAFRSTPSGLDLPGTHPFRVQSPQPSRSFFANGRIF
ncbi:MAG TPA: hypothetical protein VKC61_20020 [Pyrinomonadaceae bacterium]|nr:hypothetical protein [Pyrinomonadaceae bacterium]